MEYNLDTLKEQIEYLNCDDYKYFYDKLISEPMFCEFKHKGLICRIVKHNSFNCGYVGVPTEHKCYQYGYDNIDANAHGGLTFSDFFEHEESNYNEHYYIGFDCAHYNDFVPSMIHRTFTKPDFNKYKDHNFVKNECINLAEQLIDLDPKYQSMRRKKIISQTFLK